MNSLGKHVIIELHACDSHVLNNPHNLEEHILKAVHLSGATPIKPFFHQFSPHGVSGIVVIAESHFSIHTWPEYGYCALDIFTCGDDIHCDPAIEYLRQNLKAGHYSVMEIKRGLLDLPQSEIKHKP